MRSGCVKVEKVDYDLRRVVVVPVSARKRGLNTRRGRVKAGTVDYDVRCKVKCQSERDDVLLVRIGWSSLSRNGRGRQSRQLSRRKGRFQHSRDSVFACLSAAGQGVRTLTLDRDSACDKGQI